MSTLEDVESRIKALEIEVQVLRIALVDLTSIAVDAAMLSRSDDPVVVSERLSSINNTLNDLKQVTASDRENGELPEAWNE